MRRKVEALNIELPVDRIIPALKRELLTCNNSVLIAPPGAGKTTRVPPALIDEPWLQGKKLLMLEPRRLAAKSAARFMAAALGEAVGERVGYRMRGERRTGANTRIEVVTEGVLTRMLQNDPSLEGVGAVLFDEFHERSIHADTGLALCLEAQSVLRDDLRIVVMSATLEAEPVSSLLGGAPVLQSEGRQYAVQTIYRTPEQGDIDPVARVEETVARTIVEALREHKEGDVLAFLPGSREIRRTLALLERLLDASAAFAVYPLYGSLPLEAQEQALAAAPPGIRKIVLATNVAETSVTVNGVRIVVDSGYERRLVFSPRTGLSRLTLTAISAASADQRRGRAGRQAEGVCYRCWTEAKQRTLSPSAPPEMATADLTPLALELAQWGAAKPGELRWLTPPPEAAYRQALETLEALQAVDASGRITKEGQAMAEAGLHPRLARMALLAKRLGLGALACDIATVLEERDTLRKPNPADSDADLRWRIQVMRQARDEPAALRMREEAKRKREQLGIPRDADSSVEQCGLALAYAYPDRVAQRRPSGTYVLRNGRGAAFTSYQSFHTLNKESYLVVAEIDDAGADGTIRLCAPISETELRQAFADDVRQEEYVYWDAESGSVRARLRTTLGALTLAETPAADPDSERVTAVLLEAIRKEGLHRLPWTKPASQWRQRVQFLQRHNPAWPDRSDEALLRTLPDWLGPFVSGMRSLTELAQRLKLIDALEATLSWNERQALDTEAPTHIVVPSGSRLPIDYSVPEAPTLHVKLQEVFGWTDTPRIANGRMRLTLHLLSPAQRPVQVTQDLANFWKETYYEVKKDLKGRYPKHYWPDDPLAATATRGVKPRAQGT